MMTKIAAFAVMSLILTVTPGPGQSAGSAQLAEVGTLLRRPRVRTALDRATGTVLVALGLKVAAEQLA